jgi:glycyl-tRNA synthetase beta subunit
MEVTIVPTIFGSVKQRTKIIAPIPFTTVPNVEYVVFSTIIQGRPRLIKARICDAR